ncbi:MAG: 5'-deoxynucleotidase [Saccharofermentans sp.]|nr:5'-deoxynucleotidase [Saccharofermentans sp.]
MKEDNRIYGFYAMLNRMQYINRWGLMRNTDIENIKEHSFDVAIIAHSLALIHNEMVSDDAKVDPYKIQSYALFHDCTEIITGDLPTPIKYKNEEIKKAYKEVEHEAAERLSSLLPDFLKDTYLDLLDPDFSDESGNIMHDIVKAADKISAYLKCLLEITGGNNEFKSAMATLEKSIVDMNLPEATYFMEKFVPSYGLTLDELMKSSNEGDNK